MDAGFSVGASIVVFVTLGVMAGVSWFWSRGESAVPGAGRVAVGFAAVAFLAAVFGVVRFASNPVSLDSPVTASAAPAPQSAGNDGHAPSDLVAMAERLKARLDKDPSDGGGWVLLARTYRQVGMQREAADAYAKAITILPPDASMLADYVDLHVSSNGGTWQAGDRAALEKALAADPKHTKALALAGTEAYKRKDWAGSLGYWERMKAAALPNTDEARMAEANIAELRQLMAGKK